MTLLALAIGAYALLYLAIPEMGDPEQKAHFATFSIWVYAHIIPGGVALILGAFQFHSGLRKRWTQAHRIIGRAYVVCVLIGAVGGFSMAWFALESPATRLGFATLAIIWFYSGAMAYLAIRNRDIALHQQWMIRCYALTLAAVTLRAELGILQGVMGLSFEQSYEIVAWFSWVPNLIIAEWGFNQKRLARGIEAKA